MCKGIFIYINDPGRYDIIQFRCALVVLNLKLKNNTDPDRMPCSVMSDLGPRCLQSNYINIYEYKYI